jgi:hypothetical protein
MTDDLVKRLRGRFELCNEAADRIEMLEAELREAEGTIWSLVETINSLGDALCRRKTNER